MSTPINIAVVDNFCTGGLRDSQFTVAALLIAPGLEGLGLSDSLSDTVGTGVLVSDSNTNLNDNLDSVLVGLLVSISDTNTLTDAIAISGPGVSLGITDSLTFSDAQLVTADCEAAFSESLTLADSFSSAAPNTVSLSDTLSFSDAVSVFNGNYTLLMQDTLSLVDSDSVLLGLQLTNTDTLSFSDSTAYLGPGFWSESDTLTLVDFLKIFSPITGLDVSDSLLFTEQVSLEYELMIPPQDGLSLSDTVATNLLVIDPQVADTFAFSDMSIVQLNAPLAQSVSDTLCLSDNVPTPLVLTDFIDYLRRYLNDVIN